MKILHVIPSVAACRGGSSKAALDMVRALNQNGVNAEIACTNDNGVNTLDVKLETLTDFSNVPVRFFDRFSPDIAALREFAYSASFRDWLKDNIHRYDLLHVHALFSFCSSYAMRLAQKKGIPYVCHPIGHLEHWSLSQGGFKKQLYLQLIENRNINGASAIHCTAESEASQVLERFPNANLQVIPLGLDLPVLEADSCAIIKNKYNLDDAPILLYLARLHPKKGLDLLLHSLVKLESRSFNLLIAGEGDSSYTNQILELIHELGLSDQCQLIGYIEGSLKQQLLQAADLLVLTSHSENFAVAVLEAWANQTATLVSPEVALAQQVKKHDLGYVSSLNSEEVSQALQLALNQPIQLHEKSERARQYAQDHHQWPGLAEKLALMYQQVIAR